MQPPVLAGLDPIALAGKILAGGGIGAALFLVGRMLLRARVIATWAWLGGMFMFFLAALALADLVDVNPGRAVELGRLAWDLGIWLERTLGLGL